LSQRILRINQLIKEQLGNILLKEGNFPRDCLVTITRIETSVDLKEARVWVSVLPEKKESQILNLLNKNIYHFQQKLNKVLKLKRVPKIKFLIEKKIKEAAKIEKLLEKIRKSS
jgi:ribosome-binding factor A